MGQFSKINLNSVMLHTWADLLACKSWCLSKSSRVSKVIEHLVQDWVSSLTPSPLPPLSLAKSPLPEMVNDGLIDGIADDGDVALEYLPADEIGATAAWMLVICSCNEIDERGPRNSLPQCVQRETSNCVGKSAKIIHKKKVK